MADTRRGQLGFAFQSATTSAVAGPARRPGIVPRSPRRHRRSRPSKRSVMAGSVIEPRASAQPSSYAARTPSRRLTRPPHPAAIASNAAAGSAQRTGIRRSGVIAGQGIAAISSVQRPPGGGEQAGRPSRR